MDHSGEMETCVPESSVKRGTTHNDPSSQWCSRIQYLDETYWAPKDAEDVEGFCHDLHTSPGELWSIVVPLSLQSPESYHPEFMRSAESLNLLAARKRRQHVAELVWLLQFIGLNFLADAFTDDSTKYTQFFHKCNEYGSPERMRTQAFLNCVEEHGESVRDLCRSIMMKPVQQKNNINMFVASDASLSIIEQQIRYARRMRQHNVIRHFYPNLLQMRPVIQKDGTKSKVVLEYEVSYELSLTSVLSATSFFTTEQWKLLQPHVPFVPQPAIPNKICSKPFVIGSRCSVIGDYSRTQGMILLEPQHVLARLREFRAVNQVDMRRGTCIADCRTARDDSPVLHVLCILELGIHSWLLAWEDDHWYLCAPHGGLSIKDVTLPERHSRLLDFGASLQILRTTRELVIETYLTKLFNLHRASANKSVPILHMLLRQDQAFGW